MPKKIKEPRLHSANLAIKYIKSLPHYEAQYAHALFKQWNGHGTAKAIMVSAERAADIQDECWQRRQTMVLEVQTELKQKDQEQKEADFQKKKRNFTSLGQI